MGGERQAKRRSGSLKRYSGINEGQKDNEPDGSMQREVTGMEEREMESKKEDTKRTAIYGITSRFILILATSHICKHAQFVNLCLT